MTVIYLQFRDKVKKAPKREVTDEIEDEPQKKGKKKDYYGEVKTY